MRVDEVRANIARRFSLFAIAVLSVSFFSAPLYAQDEDVVDDQQDSTDEERATDEVVVTGSRLKRDTYSSISPLQVISGQVSREIGLIDPGTILQESTAASGVQIDLTFQGFVLDNGPGATTIDLRGLGAQRTLVLINGRRVAPGGVEGAPVSPDINLIPGALVQQYEVLLDGASSVYGSDALAGVVNVILRKDFDGFEVEAFSSIPADDFSAGIQNRLSAAWGYNGDRGFIGIGAEYRDWEPVKLNDREWTNSCDKHYEVDENGQTRQLGIADNFDLNMRPSPCKRVSLAGRIIELGSGFGSVYYTPGSSNVGIPNFSESSLYSVPVSSGADGYNTITFNDYSLNGEIINDLALIIPDLQTYSALAFGEYTFSGEANITPYFEAVYARRDSVNHAGAFQLFPVVGATNPYNPCNPDGINGVDCGLAHDDVILNDATYRAAFQDYYVSNFDCFGLPASACLPESFGLQYGAIGAVPTQVVPSVRNDRTVADVSVDQVRLVTGIRGDMPFMNFGSVEDWSFDFYLMRSESNGESARGGVREDRLDYSLNTSRFSIPGDPTSEVICGNNDGCVPINMFAPSLYQGLVGEFETQAQKDYVWDIRDFDTEIIQTLGQFYMNGEIFNLPGGEALFGLGIEYRDDEIDSVPDDIARDGLFFGFFSDRGAVGDKWTKEYFAELELPLLAGVTAFRELTANISSRHTEDEFYGEAWTYSGKLAWRPVDSLLLRGTVGTSYRAPNLRENFLLGTTGFNNYFDPCVIPDEARNPLTGGYDPALDDREPEVLANCLANGVDPTTLDLGGITVYSVETQAGGALDLNEEESESWSAGFTWEQPYFTSFDMVFGATYYEIDITNEIIDPSGQFIINDCYNDLQGDSPFCSRIRRDGDGFLDLLDRGFINRDAINARGVDLNMRIDWPTQIFGRAVDLQADFAFNRALQLETVFIDDEGEASRDELVGEFAFPEWKGRMSFRADYEDWRVTWSTRYISSVEQDAEGLDDFGNIVDGLSDTCGGPSLGDVNCRDVGYADNYFVNDMSLYYYGDVWTLGGGIRNVFNEAPPTVDSSEVFAFNNVPFGSGYDFLGRQLFLNVVWRWD